MYCFLLFHKFNHLFVLSLLNFLKKPKHCFKHVHCFLLFTTCLLFYSWFFFVLQFFYVDLFTAVLLLLEPLKIQKILLTKLTFITFSIFTIFEFLLTIFKCLKIVFSSTFYYFSTWFDYFLRCFTALCTACRSHQQQHTGHRTRGHTTLQSPPSHTNCLMPSHRARFLVTHFPSPLVTLTLQVCAPEKQNNRKECPMCTLRRKV